MSQLLFCSGDHRGTQPTAARRRHSLKEERRIKKKEPLHFFSLEMTLLRNVVLKSVGSVQAFKNESTRANRLDCRFFFAFESQPSTGRTRKQLPPPTRATERRKQHGRERGNATDKRCLPFFVFKLARLHSSFVESTTPAVDKP